MDKPFKTTCYYDTFIEVAEDSQAKVGSVPPERTGNKSVAGIEYEMICGHPYKYTSDEVLFEVYARRNNIGEPERQQEWDKFFSKGQACLRASPLAKTYGWGIHFNSEGKVAIYGVNSDSYQKFAKDSSLKHYKAMRTKRAKS